MCCELSWPACCSLQLSCHALLPGSCSRPVYYLASRLATALIDRNHDTAEQSLKTTIGNGKEATPGAHQVQKRNTLYAFLYKTPTLRQRQVEQDALWGSKHVPRGALGTGRPFFHRRLRFCASGRYDSMPHLYVLDIQGRGGAIAPGSSASSAARSKMCASGRKNSRCDGMRSEKLKKGAERQGPCQVQEDFLPQSGR